MGRTIQGSKSSGREIFLAHPDRSRGLTRLQYKECRLFPTDKNGQGVLQNNPPLLALRLRMDWLCTFVVSLFSLRHVVGWSLLPIFLLLSYPSYSYLPSHLRQRNGPSLCSLKLSLEKKFCCLRYAY